MRKLAVDHGISGGAVSLLCLLGSFACSAVDFRAPEIIPVPKKMSYEASVPVWIDAATRFSVACPDKSAAAWVKSKSKAWFGVDVAAIDSSAVAGADGLGEEGYTLSASPGRIAIGANSPIGVKYAMYTLRQVAERETGGLTVMGYWLPVLRIEDEPALKFRGVHFCWFPECSASQIERQIRVAAYYKFNYAVVENWGVFKSEKHPYLAVPGAPLTTAEAKRLVSIAKDLGVTLVPQLNVYGHAALLRAMGGKHSTLDYHPEYQPLFEPFNGWNWCLSNPDARKVVLELVEELHEAFGNPPFFHIGCDEADPPTCPVCRSAKPYAALVEAQIVAVVDLLRKRGARAMMWHDMLLEKGKWEKPLRAHGDKDEAKMADTLPRDIVVCDWYYEGARKGYPTLDHLSAKGFSVLTCPWRNGEGIFAQAAHARENRLFGVLETTWHHCKGQEFGMMMSASACGAWGSGRPHPWRQGGYVFATHWRQCGWDMGTIDYADTGFYSRQVTRDAVD